MFIVLNYFKFRLLNNIKTALFTGAIAGRFESSDLIIIKSQPPCLAFISGFPPDVLMFEFNNKVLKFTRCQLL